MWYIHAKCITGPSGFMYTGLSVGSHTIEVMFTPDGSSQMIPFDSPFQFNISPAPTTIPIGNYYYCWHVTILSSLTLFQDATASVSVSGDTATITLTGDGDFECMLDDGPFMPCKLVLLQVINE